MKKRHLLTFIVSSLGLVSAITFAKPNFNETKASNTYKLALAQNDFVAEEKIVWTSAGTIDNTNHCIDIVTGNDENVNIVFGNCYSTVANNDYAFIVKLHSNSASFDTYMHLMAFGDGDTEITPYQGANVSSDEYTFVQFFTATSTVQNKGYGIQIYNPLAADYKITSIYLASVNTYSYGDQLGTLPTLTSGVWAIDNVAVDNSSCFNYASDKVAFVAEPHKLAFAKNELISNDKIDYISDGSYVEGVGISIETTGECGVNITTKSAYSVEAGKEYAFIAKMHAINQEFNTNLHVCKFGDGDGNETEYLNFNVTLSEYTFVQFYTASATVSNKSYGLQFYSGTAVKFVITEIYFAEAKSVIKGGRYGNLLTLESGKAWAVDGNIVTSSSQYTKSEDSVAYVTDAYKMIVAKDELISSGKVIYSNNGINTANDYIFNLSGSAENILDLSQSFEAGKEYAFITKFKAIESDFSMFVKYVHYTNNNVDLSSFKQIDLTANQEYTDIFYWTPSDNFTNAGVGPYIYNSAACKFAITECYIAEIKYVIPNKAIGTLPTTSYEWCIDNEVVNSETIYSYGKDTIIYATYTAKLFINYFNSVIVCDSTGSNGISLADWTKVLNQYSYMNEYQKSLLKSQASGTTTDLEKFASKYDYIVSKYGYSNFANRTVASKTQSRTNFSLNTNSNGGFAIIVVISMVAIAGLSIKAFLKKKEN